MATYSREGQTNWYRASRLLTEGGKGILIDFLKQSIGSCTLDSYLSSKRNDVNKIKQLHPPQKDILYPPGGGNTDPRQWDITLTSCIINKLIKPTDPLQKSSIDDIRQLRNEIFGHCGELRMNQSEFQTNWSKIKQVLCTASVSLLHTAGPFYLTTLEKDIENDEVTNVSLNAMKHILDNWVQCDTVGGLSEVKSVVEGVKSALEKQTEGLSEVTSGVDGLKSVMEKQSVELSGLRSDVEGLKKTIAREDRPRSVIKDFSCSILEGQGPASMQSQSPNDQETTAENISLSSTCSTSTDTGCQTRTGLPSEFEDLQSYLVEHYKKYVIKTPTAVNTARGQTYIDDIYVDPNLVLVDHTAPTQETAKEEDISIEHIFHYNKCRLIYLNGDAGMGKTSLTKYLVSEWCKSHSHDKNTHAVNTLSSMKQFDFLFYIPLRNAKGIYKIGEMIVAHLLNGYSCIEPCSKTKTNPEQFLDGLLEHWSDRCLIILDGLDEWKAPEKSSCPAVSDGIPGRSPHLKYTLLTTSRPWKMEQLRLEECEIDRQLKLKGVKSVWDYGVKLVSYFNKRLKKDKKYADFEHVLEEEGLRKMSATPILLKQLLCLWFHEQSFSKSKTEIYTNMVDLLLQLAEQRENVKQFNTNEKPPSETIPTPSCFRKGGRCEKYKSLLLKLGRLAFETQFCGEGESRLVFETDETEAYGMTEEEIDVCLSVGILTQDIVPEPLCDMKRLSFIHKTFHEYFTALYVSAYGENLNDIETRFSDKSLTLVSLLDMEDTVIFLGGMCPLFLKDTVSKYLVEIVNKNENVERYRYDNTAPLTYIQHLATIRRLTIGIRVQSMILACCKECSSNGHSPLCLPLTDYIDSDILQSEQLSQEELNILDICLRHYPLQLKSFNFLQNEFRILDDSQGIKQHLNITPYINLCRLVIIFRYKTCINLAVSMPKLEYIVFRNVSSSKLSSLIESARKLKVLILDSIQCNDQSTGIQSCDLDLSEHKELIRLYLKDMSFGSLAVTSSLRNLHIETTCLLRHDTLCNLMTVISDTRSITCIHLGSVRCREHDKGLDCGYSIELSECRELEKLYLEGISPESVTLSPSISRLLLKNIHTFKHDALCSLMASISNTRSFICVHLESVRCRDHGRGVTCGFTVDLTGHDNLMSLGLHDLSPVSVRIGEDTSLILLSDIHTLQHDELSELLSIARNVRFNEVSRVTCAEHGKSSDRMDSLELEGVDELFWDVDNVDLDDELFSDEDDADLNLQHDCHLFCSGEVSNNQHDAENKNVVDKEDLYSHAENMLSNTDTTTDDDDNGESNLELEGTCKLHEDTGDVTLQH